MVRDNQLEILESAVIPEALVKSAYDDLARIHRWLGDTSAIVRAIRRNPLPVRRILEVGCGTGLILENVRQKLGADVVGVNIDPHPNISAPVPILRADAVHDELPRADVAFSMNVCHHLDEDELIQTIRNVGRSCERFIILDLIRHPLPLALFRVFVAPFVCAINVEDGERSIHGHIRRRRWVES